MVHCVDVLVLDNEGQDTEDNDGQLLPSTS